MRGQQGGDGVTRRQALQLGTVAAGVLAFEVNQVTAAVADAESRPARERSFDEG